MPVKSVGVIAATQTDTRMGVDLLRSKGFTATGASLGSNPQEQTLWQVFSREMLTQQVSRICSEFAEQGVGAILIYCNSLSTAIDLASLRKRHGQIGIHTPLETYADLAKDYHRLTIMAANGQSLSGLESVFYAHNPDIAILGLSMLPIIQSIENELDPSDIVAGFRLQCVLELSQAFGSEAVLFGCTHFPYFEKCLMNMPYGIPIVDPSLMMINRLAGDLTLQAQ